MDNPIVEFIQGGGSLLSEEGTNLILKCSRDEIRKALQDNDVARALIQTMSNSTNPDVKAAILLVIQTH